MPKQGYITPSRFKDVLTSSRGDKGFGKTAINYANELVLNHIGIETQDISAPALEWGNLHEPEAIKAYEMDKMVSIQQPDVLFHPKYDFICGTPDGLLQDGIIEVKCPYKVTNHLDNIVYNAQVNQYNPQMQGYMWITGAEWCDFVSYDPRYPKDLQLHVHRVERDDKFIKHLEKSCIEFWQIVQDKLKALTS